MKKVSLLLTALFLSVEVFAADFALSFKPEFSFPINSLYKNTLAGTVGIEFAPITNIRGRDSIFLGINGGITPVVANGLDNLFVYDGSLSLGYSFRLNDRINISAEGYGGLWFFPAQKNGIVQDSFTDVLFGGRAGVNYYLLPEIQIGLFADYGILSSKDSPFMQKLSAGINFRYSFSSGLFSSSKIETTEITNDQLFPVFYSYYADHSFGEITFQNKENTDIIDVEVSIFIEQYMSNPDITLKVDRIPRGESFSTPLIAFLNENILNTMGASETGAVIKVSYKSLGKRVQYEKNIVLNTVSRNSMTWEDDRRAAAFVSGRDASAYTFAQRVKSIVRDHLNPNVPQNIQYAAAMFSALKLYGINYVIDPASAFTDNVGTNSVDFLQFPYQTLLYHGGDCDDLTILNCALLDAIGIKTAFITVPGHIYMAFDSGVSPEQADLAGNHVVLDDTVWIPLEITLCQDDFALERLIGYRQFIKHGDNAVIIPLDSAWKEYKAVSMSDSDVRLEYPSSEAIVQEFKKQKY